MWVSGYSETANIDFAYVLAEDKRKRRDRRSSGLAPRVPAFGSCNVSFLLNKEFSNAIVLAYVLL